MKSEHFKLKIACVSLLSLAAVATRAQFTAGNLVVLQIGNGGTLSSAAAPLFLDQFVTTTAGQTVAPFITIASDGTGLVLSGSASSEGSLTRSTDGSILTFGGYSAASGTATIASGTAPREVGVVNASGQFSIAANSSTALNGNNIRGAVSDGQNYWIAGASGVFYQASGSSSLVQVTNSNSRVANLFNGNLEYSTGSGANHAVFAYSGTPTSLTASSLFIGSGNTASPYDFFINGTTAYVADDNASGGIQRWDYNGSAWVLSYTIGTGAGSVGARQLTVDPTTAGGATIFATTAEGSANRLISVQDVGSAAADAGTLITLATAPAGELFRGVDFGPVSVPEPSTLALAGFGLAALWNFRRRKS